MPAFLFLRVGPRQLKFHKPVADREGRRPVQGERRVIDTDKGLDVAPRAAHKAQSAAHEAATGAAAALDAVRPARTAAGRVPFDQELERAARLYRAARPQVMSMFQEARLGKAIDAERAAALVEEIGASVTRNPDALISLARLKNSDEYTFMHSVAVCALMTALARQLGFDDEATHQAGLGGLMHDVGKAKIANEVLNKPGALTDAEFADVRRHPELGHAILREGNTPSDVVLDGLPAPS
jgi:putative nucleotidyltransferase with HDIG domain